MVRCTQCQRQMEWSTAPFQVHGCGYRLMLDAVPAWICTVCGDMYFADSQVDAIREVIRALDSRTSELAMPA